MGSPRGPTPQWRGGGWWALRRGMTRRRRTQQELKQLTDTAHELAGRRDEQLDGHAAPFNLPEEEPNLMPSIPPEVSRSALAHGAILGQVRFVQERQETGGYLKSALLQMPPETVVTFRVDMYDQGGQRVDSVEVEMRGHRIDGGLTEGDWVKVKGHRGRDGNLYAKSLYNYTTKSHFRIR
jgi:hypothetical protein